MNDMKLAVLLFVTWCLVSPVHGGEPHVMNHENVLGTSLEIRVWCESASVATRAEEAVLAEIDRMARIVSTYDSTSEFSRWQSAGRFQELSPELTHLLRSCDQWRERTDGAFHPGVERVSKIWRAAEMAKSLPDQSELETAVRRLKEAPWRWNGAKVEPQPDYPVTFNAIAKGAIVDAASLVAMKVPGVDAVSVAVGGDLRCLGDRSHKISIPSPRPELTRGAIIEQFEINNQGVATSSGAYRGFTIEGKRYSHLIDPRNGQPVDHVLSATVVAPTTEQADVLATACSVLTVQQSLDLVASLDHVECLLVDRDGKRHFSPGWNGLSRSEPTSLLCGDDEKAEPWNGGFELKLDLEINQPDGGRRYKRPYVAVWVEDREGYPVKTLILWVQSTGKGPRWIPDLKRWYRSDRVRKESEETDLVELVSEATRKPGKYSTVWKGQDNRGKLVAPGEYTVYIESAREHGTYQLSRKKVTIGKEPFAEEFESNVEIKAAKFEYRLSTPAAKN